ncbi:MAG: hypothetical protein GXO32_02155 [Crenarchaeota archaeon]|nr:hypothetical protein [Thermoproteota archaeon]
MATTRISRSIRSSSGAISVGPAKAEQVLLHIDPVSLDLAVMAIARGGAGLGDLERFFDALVPGLGRLVRYELRLLSVLGYVVLVDGVARTSEKGRRVLESAGVSRPIDVLRLLAKALGWWVVRECLDRSPCSELLRSFVGGGNDSR